MYVYVCVCMEDNIRLQYVWVRANNSNNYLQLRLSVSFKLDWSVERFVSAFYAFHIHSEATWFEWNSNAYTNARPEQLAVLALRFALSLITLSLTQHSPYWQLSMLLLLSLVSSAKVMRVGPHEVSHYNKLAHWGEIAAVLWNYGDNQRLMGVQVNHVSSN